MSKKPFSETKIGKFINEKVKPIAGDVIGIIGDVTGIEAIERVGDLINSRKEESAEMMALHMEFEKYKLEWQLEIQRLELEEFKTEIADKDSARNMRNEFTKAGKIDLEHFIVNMIGLALFCFLVTYLVARTVPQENREIIIHVLGIIEGVVLSIYGFHNGSTRGSRKKDETISKLTK